MLIIEESPPSGGWAHTPGCLIVSGAAEWPVSRIPDCGLTLPPPLATLQPLWLTVVTIALCEKETRPIAFVVICALSS